VTNERDVVHAKPIDRGSYITGDARQPIVVPRKAGGTVTKPTQVKEHVPAIGIDVTRKPLKTGPKIRESMQEQDNFAI